MNSRSQCELSKMFEKNITQNDENAKCKNKYETVRGKEEKPLRA